MRLHAMDAWVRTAAVLTDEDALRAGLHAAAAAGGATVVGEEFYAFPNGAVTGVLLLAQSHLSIHTWPELGLANVDLLTCGDIDGRRRPEHDPRAARRRAGERPLHRAGA